MEHYKFALAAFLNAKLNDHIFTAEGYEEEDIIDSYNKLSEGQPQLIQAREQYISVLLAKLSDCEIA